MTETKEDPALPNIHRARFVTIAPGMTESPKSWLSGELFEFFYANTRDNAESDAATDLVERALQARLGSIPVIGADDVPGKDGRDNGFLSSGAKFREKEFERLYELIAQEIDLSIRTPARTPAPATSARRESDRLG